MEVRLYPAPIGYLDIYEPLYIAEYRNGSEQLQCVGKTEELALQGLREGLTKLGVQYPAGQPIRFSSQPSEDLAEPSWLSSR